MTTDIADQTAATQADQSATQADSGTEDFSNEQAILDDLTAEKETQAEDSTEAEAEGTDADKPDDDLAAQLATEAIDAKAQAKADELVAQRLKEAEAQRAEKEEQETRRKEDESLSRWFDSAAPQVRSRLEERGLDKDDVDWVLNQFVGLRGNAARVLGPRFDQTFRSALAEHLPDSERESFVSGDFKSSKEMAAAFAEKFEGKSREGYVSEAKAQEREKFAKLSLVRDLTANDGEKLRALMSRTRAPSANLGGYSTNGKSEDELLLDENTPIEVVNSILARRNGQ